MGDAEREEDSERAKKLADSKARKVLAKVRRQEKEKLKSRRRRAKQAQKKKDDEIARKRALGRERTAACRKRKAEAKKQQLAEQKPVENTVADVWSGSHAPLDAALAFLASPENDSPGKPKEG